MIELSMIRDLVAIFGVIAGFTYYVLTVQATRKNQRQQLETRRTQLFMDIKNTYDDTAFIESHKRVLNTYHWENFEDYIEKYGPEGDQKKSSEIQVMLNFYNGLGVLLALDRIDIELVGMHWGYMPVRFWNKMESVILGMREAMNQTYMYGYVEFLKDESLKRESYPRGKASYLGK